MPNVIKQPKRDWITIQVERPLIKEVDTFVVHTRQTGRLRYQSRYDFVKVALLELLTREKDAAERGGEYHSIL